MPPIRQRIRHADSEIDDGAERQAVRGHEGQLLHRRRDVGGIAGNVIISAAPVREAQGVHAVGGKITLAGTVDMNAHLEQRGVGHRNFSKWKDIGG